MFSGGVGEYVYDREARDFGDLGRSFGRAIRERLDAGRLPFPLLPAGECIRATALGASEYSVQLSGNTIYLSSPGDLLPRKNLQVIQPPVALGDVVDPAAVAAAIREHFDRFDLDRRRCGSRARVPLARRACVSRASPGSRAASSRRCRARLRRRSRCSSFSTATSRRRLARC